MTEQKRPHVSELRRGDIEIEAITKGAESLRQIAQALDESADYATSLGITKIHIDGVTKLERAVKELRAFRDNAQRGVNQAADSH